MTVFNLFKKHNKKISSEDTILSPTAPFAFSEAYKMLRTNIKFATMNKHKKLLITSSVPNEGKSTVAINIAISLAETGAKVLIIDCDMRNPCVHKYIRVRNLRGAGLSSVLAGSADVNDSIVTYKRGDDAIFDFIPVGSIPPNPAELLGSETMKDLLDMLSEHYDYIICDTPPVTVVSDTAILSRYCDGVLLVIKQKFSTKQQVQEAKQNLESVGATILGTILNQYNIADDRKKSSGHYGYGKDKYGYGYGYGYGQQPDTTMQQSTRRERIKQ